MPASTILSTMIPDKSLVLVYLNSEDYLTQFSLDTDWIAALAEVKKKLAE